MPAAFFLSLFSMVQTSSYAGSASMKLINELEGKWQIESDLLEGSCRIGRKLNNDALSFWNPFISKRRVEAFQSAPEELMEYVDNPAEVVDKDTLSAFADAKEAALLRAMRKRCPDIW